MQILITNDDGINAIGLEIAEAIAFEICKERKDIIIVAPSKEQSGSGHGLESYRNSINLERVGHNRYQLDGTPADCVLAGVTHIMKRNKPDLIIAGVNRGHNISKSILYSGTVGAAVEGALHGIRSIALSQSYSEETYRSKTLFKYSKKYGSEICELLLDFPYWKRKASNILFNVNFPSSDLTETTHFKFCEIEENNQNPFHCKITEELPPNSIKFRAIYKSDITAKSNQYGDKTYLSQGYTTITPLNPNITDLDSLLLAKEIFNDRKLQ